MGFDDPMGCGDPMRWGEAVVDDDPVAAISIAMTPRIESDDPAGRGDPLGCGFGDPMACDNPIACSTFMAAAISCRATIPWAAAVSRIAMTIAWVALAAMGCDDPIATLRRPQWAAAIPWIAELRWVAAILWSAQQATVVAGPPQRKGSPQPVGSSLPVRSPQPMKAPEPVVSSQPARRGPSDRRSPWDRCSPWVRRSPQECRPLKDFTIALCCRGDFNETLATLGQPYHMFAEFGPT